MNRIRRKLGMVFQSFNLFGHLTAIENIMRPQIDLLGRSRQEAYDRGLELLGRVGLAHMELRYPDELSGGQKQRVAIARALAMDPEIILLDEPTSALDPAMIGEVEAVIRDLANAGKTMMIVTHEMSFARSISNRVFYMDDGGIDEEGTPEQLFTNPQKELTRRFICKLKVLELEIEDASFDFPGANGRIADYCSKNQIPPKMELRIQLVFEELVLQFLLPKLTDARLRFQTEYSEAEESAEIDAAYSGEAIELETAENQLSLTLIKGIVSDLNCESERDGHLNNQISMRIR